MSTLAKAFVVILLLLSVLVAVATMGLFAQRTDWRQKSMAAADKIKEVTQTQTKDKASFEDQLRQKNDKIGELTARIEDKDHEIDVVTTQRDENASQVKDSEAKLAQAMTQNSKLSDSVQMLTERVAQLENQVETTKAEKEKAFEREQKQFNRAAEMDRQLNRIQERLKEANITIRNLRQDIVRARRGEEIEGIQAPAEISGIVRMKKNNLVAISVGSDDGVKMDYLFHVYRGDNYLGRLIVTYVDPDVSLAQIQEKYTSDPASIKEGDNVSTILGE